MGYEGEKPRHRFGYIDGLRGVAALLVVVMHLLDYLRPLAQPPAFSMIDWMLTRVVDIGKVGVLVFFAISGFVIPSSFNNSPNPLGRFVIGRFFRLYPAYWLSVVSGIIIAVVSHSPIDYAAVAINLTMLQRFFGYSDLLGIYWTLQLEIVFYVLCCAMFLMRILNESMWNIVAIVGLLLAAIAMSWLRYSYGTKLPVALPLSLAMMFWGHIWRTGTDSGNRKPGLSLAVVYAAAMIPISLLAYNNDMGFGETWYRYCLTYVGSLVFFMLATYYKMFSIARWLGAISYSIYLFHTFVIFLAFHFFSRLISVYGIMFWSVLLVTVVCAVSAVIYILLERPMIELGKRLTGSKHPLSATSARNCPVGTNQYVGPKV